MDTNDSIQDIFLFETNEYIEKLEQLLLESEKANEFSSSTIGEVFRIMHNIKSSSAMMNLNNISTLAHAVEDLFSFLREQKDNGNIDSNVLYDILFESVDFIKGELEKLSVGEEIDGDSSVLIDKIKTYYHSLREETGTVKQKNSYKAIVYFHKDDEMVNIRAFAIVHSLEDIAEKVTHSPEDLIDGGDATVQVINEQGFTVSFESDLSYHEVMSYFNNNMVSFREIELISLASGDQGEEQAELAAQQPLSKDGKTKGKKEQSEKQGKKQAEKDSLPEEQPPEQGQAQQEGKEAGKEEHEAAKKTENESIKQEDKATDKAEQNQGEKKVGSASAHAVISVDVNKLDKLMDLVGEMVITEAMVTENAKVEDLETSKLKTAVNQLQKLTTEVQDIVMSIRMVPLVVTFRKMHRIVRDMSKKLNKQVELEIIGEETEVDKNVIDHLSDPLMHLVRNALDHGIETPEERMVLGKTDPAKITVEAQNAGSEVLIIVRDNGKGLNKAKILQRAMKHNLFNKPESELTDKEIYNIIFHPGFSTKENVTEFSGRGVGLDVVMSNIELMGGTVSVDSVPNEGTTITMKIPLTLAIIDGMNISIGGAYYTIPTTVIKKCFRPQKEDLIIDPNGNELILVRGECFPILRLHEVYNIKNNVSDFTEGIFIMVENEQKTYCIFADELIGQRQVVVKTLPLYLKNITKAQGVSGCTLLGDGSISLILDTARLY